jgi:hypothetical protein
VIPLTLLGGHALLCSRFIHGVITIIRDRISTVVIRTALPTRMVLCAES